MLKPVRESTKRNQNKLSLDKANFVVVILLKVIWGYSSAGRAPALHAGGSRVRISLSPPAQTVRVEGFEEIFHYFLKFSKKTKKITGVAK